MSRYLCSSSTMIWFRSLGFWLLRAWMFGTGLPGSWWLFSGLPPNGSACLMLSSWWSWSLTWLFRPPYASTRGSWFVTERDGPGDWPRSSSFCLLKASTSVSSFATRSVSPARRTWRRRIDLAWIWLINHDRRSSSSSISLTFGSCVGHHDRCFFFFLMEKLKHFPHTAPNYWCNFQSYAKIGSEAVSV